MITRSTKLSGVVAAALLIAAASSAFATVLNVPSSAYPNIQAAINASGNGDTIYVAAGTYKESLSWAGKDLTIQGAGEGLSIVDPSAASGGPGGRCLLASGLTSASSIGGFTFRNGYAPGDYGGGIAIVTGSPSVTNCTFAGNRGDAAGGEIYAGSGSALVTHCTFSGNSASFGGGMFSDSGSPTVTHCTFAGNSASGNGGGMYNTGAYPATISDLNVINCVFTGNSAGDSGGGLYCFLTSASVINCVFSGNSASYLGGGMCSDASDVNVANCTFTGNSVHYGGGMFNTDYSLAVVTNCIFWGNVGSWGYDGIGDEDTSEAFVTYSDEQDFLNLPPADNNFAADPLFVDAANGDFRLQPGSPCINAGNNAVVTPPPFLMDPTNSFTIDLDGRHRIYGAAVDLGAYEWQPNQAPVLTVQGTAAVNVGCPVTYKATATDPDGDTLTFSKSSGPAWATVTGGGLVTLNPPAATVGTFSVSVRVTDPSGAWDEKSTSVTVCPIIIESLIVSKKNGITTVQFSVRNTDGTIVSNVSLNSSTLSAISTATALPIVFPQLKPGVVKSVLLKFQNVSGGPAQFVVNGSSSAGPVCANLTVNVP